jgi:putative transposase
VVDFIQSEFSRQNGSRQPWQNPFVERVIGSIRRECLDHVIIINERHLRRFLSSYVRYYYKWRTHSRSTRNPETRPILPPAAGKIVAVAQLGGLHHPYERRAA